MAPLERPEHVDGHCVLTNAIQHHHTGYWHCQGPENTTRQICTIHTVNHVPNAPLARVLTGSTFKSGLRAPPLPHTRRAAPRAEHRCRRLARQDLAGASSSLKPERLAIDQRRLRRPFGRLRRPRMRRLPRGRCSAAFSNCQAKAANCRAQRGKWCEQGAKNGG